MTKMRKIIKKEQSFVDMTDNTNYTEKVRGDKRGWRIK